MRRFAWVILALAAPTSWAFADAGDDGGASVLTRSPKGSLARQLRLKLSLEMVGGQSLSASLDHNRPEWEMLSPEQREEYRHRVMAFLQKDPDAQDKLLENYSAFLALTQEKRDAYRRRAQWVQAVVATLTPAQRDELRQMSSTDRAKALIARRDQLVRAGKLKLDVSPTDAPARSEDPPGK